MKTCHVCEASIGNCKCGEPNPIPTLGQCLKEAEHCITDERQDTYGNPEDSFALIAEYWDTYLRHRLESNTLYRKLQPIDVAHMMSLFKHGRMLGQSPKRDNYVDACGYLSIAADRLLC